MAINNMTEKFMHGLGDIYDAEHQFLKGQEEMLQHATFPNLQKMISMHIDQTKQQISNLDQVFNLLGQQPNRISCEGAKGIVSEGKSLLKQTSSHNEITDCAIAGAASKVEHYEIASYTDLITAADLMGQRQIVSLLQQNLEQEQSMANLIAQSSPQLLQMAMQQEGQFGQPGSFSQSSPTC